MKDAKNDLRVRCIGAVCIGRIQWIDRKAKTAMVKFEGTSFAEYEIPLAELEAIENEPI